MSLTRRIAHNTIIQYTGTIIGTVFGLVTIGLMTRYLGKDGFGYYTTVMAFLQFFGILVDLGLSLTTARMLGHSKWDSEQLFANILSLRIISAIIFLGIAPFVGLLFPYPGFVKVGIAITSLSFFFMAITQIFLGYYQKHLAMQYVSIAEVGNRIFLLLAILCVMFYDWGFFGVLIIVILSNLVQLILLAIPAKKYGRIRLKIDLPIWKDIWLMTWPIAVSIALNLLYLKSDVIILSLYRTPGEVGLYGAAYKVIEVLTIFPIMFAGLLLPLLSQFWQMNDRTRFQNLMQQGFDAMSLLAWPIIVGTIFVASDVMVLIAGEEFRDAGIILQLLIFASALIFFKAVFAHAIVALNKQKQTIWVYAVTAVLGLIGYFLLIPTYGPLAAAGMTVATEAIVAMLIFILYRKYSSVKTSIKRWIPAILSSAGMGGVLWYLQDFHVLYKILIGIGVYGILIILTRGVTKEFIKDLFTLRKFPA